MKIRLIILAGALAVALFGAVRYLRSPVLTPEAAASADPRPPNAPEQRPAFSGQTDAPLRSSNVAFDIVTVAGHLESPWGLAFLPDGRMLVTERPGRLRIVNADGGVSAPISGIPRVAVAGQGGLLDVAVDPDFATTHLIFWTYAEPQSDGRNNTAAARGVLVDGDRPQLEHVQTIYHQVPPLRSSGHFGGRLVFARDGTLFVTQGERVVEEGRRQAQQLDSLLGKIVRINRDGSIPSGNPFVGRTESRPPRAEIWSFGHRNVEAATLHPETGELWEVEHGTRGGDELNVVRPGRNYGWPTIAYGIEYSGRAITGGVQRQQGMEQPIYYWDPVIAPSGMTFYTGSLFPSWKNNLFIGGLGSQALVRLTIDGERVVDEERLLTDMRPRERIRDVVQGPEGALYLLTDNDNGRLLKLVPRKAS